MQEENLNLNRRTFLRHSATSMVWAGATTLLPNCAREEMRTGSEDRKAPETPVMLRSSELQVTFDAKDGVPYNYRLHGQTLRGEDSGQPISVRICSKAQWRFSDTLVNVERVEQEADHVAFCFMVREDSTPAVEFKVRYRLEHATLQVSLEDIEEQQGYELISVNLPRLVTVREEDGAAWLVHGDTGGSITMLSDAVVASLQPNPFWGDVLGTLPVVMVGTEHMMCVQETTAYMDSTFLNVTGSDGKKRASIGTAQIYRVDGGQCYEMNAGKDVPRNCGTAKTPNLLVGQPSSCRLDFIAVQGNVEDAWLQGAKLVRERMPEIPNHFYDDKYIYGIRCDEPLFPKPAATFEECETRIQNVAALIDRWPQVVHLWGWQFRGKDTGYPAVNEVNARIGGYEGLMQVMKNGKSHNATVTLSDNYDDAYRSSPAWNDSIIARRPDGQLWKSRNWTGEDSYILGMEKYMAGPGAERVRYTCERYKLPETIHVDVLSYFAIRNDWDPEHPASGIKNLLDGRYKVLRDFRAHGVDVSSEALRYPMIGHISCYWYAQGPGRCPFGGKRIPLLPLIYRKSAVWGLSGGHEPDETMTRLNELFLGASPRAVGLTNNDTEAVTDIFYLWLVPWFKLHLRNIESFSRDDDKTIIGLEGNSSIEIDWIQKTHKVALDGVEVASTGQVTCPLGEDRMALYASTTKVLTVALPKEWDVSTVGAVAISSGQRAQAEFKLIGRNVEVHVAAKQPVILYKNRSRMRLSEKYT
jgi:hypothetical protein